MNGPNVARAFGDVLKAIKRNNHGIAIQHEVSSAKRKIDENEDEAEYLESNKDVVFDQKMASFKKVLARLHHLQVSVEVFAYLFSPITLLTYIQLLDVSVRS